MYYLGFDIGASSIKAALVKDKEIIKKQLEETPLDLDGLLVSLENIFNGLAVDMPKKEINGLGFGFAGMFDGRREIMLNSPNIGYLDNQPLKKLLEKKFGFSPVKVEHDANCFLLAEKETGLAKKFKNVFYLTLGSGVGGAWMTDGKIFTGSHGAAAEVGHMILDIHHGFDLERLVSNKFIVSFLGAASDQAGKLAEDGDARAQEVLSQMGKNLGVGVANIINIFDPEAIIISGGLSEAKKFILPGIEEGIKKFVVSPAARETEILFSQLGRFGGAFGAALLAADNIN